MDHYGFYTGKIFDAYEYLGAHIEGGGVTFRTFAPAAGRVALIGEFNGWQETPMDRVHDGNFWACHMDNAKPGTMYKYRIYGRDGNYFIDHCDPYGYGMELRPACASIIRDMDAYQFSDEEWMRTRTDCKNKPLNIYEIHFGSFRKPGPEADDWYNYEELAPILIPYLKENGYNCVEVMPLTEYPCDESWGYQVTGFYSPTARYGAADQLKAFIDACHQNGIGVIMDFVPVHFAVDGYALAKYDGTNLYEYPNSAVGESEWGSCNFMHSRGEVRSFLQSAANYWLREYHFDGLRMDAISRAIYWQGDPARGVNGSAVDFLKYMNQGLKGMHPSAILAAEDSTAFPGVTTPVDQGGLGFDYKWDMGWMNDTLNYFRTPPELRTEAYHKLTFSMMYYYDANHLLPLSHDETVHGKASVFQKMAGEYDEKHAQIKAFYMYMYAHPGKKLNFMGNEFAQVREWDEKQEQDWDLLKYPLHDNFHRFMGNLNRIYLDHPALWAKDYGQEGFQWIDCHQESKCVYAFERTGGKERLAAVFNFSDREQTFQMKLENAKKYRVLLDSNAPYRETGATGDMPLPADGVELALRPYTAVYYLVG